MLNLTMLRLLLFQPTRPLRGATLFAFILLLLNHLISTHAPLAGRDCLLWSGRCFYFNFNPRAPCGARLHGATASL